MVSTSFWSWRFDEDIDGLRRLLAELLKRDRDDPGYILAVSSKEIVTTGRDLDSNFLETTVEQLYETPAPAPDWVSGATAVSGTVVESIVSRLQHIGERWQHEVITLGQAMRALRPMTVRVFLPPPRARWLFGTSNDETFASYSVCLNIAFTRFVIEEREYTMCLVNASVWSDQPYSGWHAPPHGDAARPAFDVRQIENLAQFYLHDVRCGIRQVLREHLRPTPLLTVQNTPYVAPVYWVVGGEPAASLNVAASLLCTTDLESAPVSRSVLGGSLPMYRRTLGDASVLNVPFYVLLPDLDANRVRETGISPKQRAALQEETAADAVLAESEIEAQIAALAFDIDTDVSLWEHYLQLYDETTQDGGALWDAVAMHLPAARGPDLHRAHYIVSLIHQVLLQSVSDLAYVANRLEATSARLGNEVARLQVEFDARIAERRVAPGSNSAALGSDGYLGLERRRIEGATAEIGRIRGNFEGLFGAITKAFDERRTRDTDRFSRANFVVAIGVAAFGIVTLMTAAFDFANDTNRVGALWLGIGTGLIGVVAIAFCIPPAIQMWRGRPLGRKSFPAEYDELRDFLRKVSTEELRKFDKKLERRRKDAPLPTPSQLVDHGAAHLRTLLGKQVESRPAEDLDDAVNVVWNELDENLSALLVEMWRKVYRDDESPRVTEVRADLDVIENNVSRWAMRAMLVNERPPELYRYNLPRLISLYCALSAAERDISVNAVAEADIGFMVRGLGFEARHSAEFYRWLSRARKGVAVVVDDVAELGLRNGMTKDELEAALKVIYKRDAG